MSLASGQITIIDYTDAVALMGYLSVNKPRTQFLTMNGVYTPDWTQPADNITIDSELYLMGGGSNLISTNDPRVSNIRWYYRLDGDSNYTQINGTGSYALSTNSGCTTNSTLTIKGNVMTATQMGLAIQCLIDYKHSTALPTMTYKIDVDFNLSKQAETYTAVLDNESVTVVCDNDGTVNPGSQLGASGIAKTSIIVYKGAVVQNPTVGSVATDQFKLTLGTVPANVTAAIGADNQSVYISAIGASVESGSIPITITLDNGSTIVKQFCFSKAKKGAVGSRSAVLQMFKWDTAVPTLFPVGSSTYTWANGTFTNPGTTNGWSQTVGAGTQGQTLYVVKQYYSDGTSNDTSSVTWSASSCAVAGAAGSNGARTAVLTMYLWSANAPSSYPTGTSTYTWSNGSYTAASTPNSWTLVPGAPVAGQTLYAVSQSYSDVQTTPTSTVTWSTTTALVVGSAGTNAKYLSLVGEQTYKYAASATTPSNTTITLTANPQNTANTTATWQYYIPGGSPSSPTTLSAEASKVTFTTGAAPTVAITHDATVWGSNSVMTIVCTIDGVTDRVTLSKARDGANPIVDSCWAPNGDVFKNANGNKNPSLTLQFDIYDGSTLATATGYKWYKQDTTVTNFSTTLSSAASSASTISVPSTANLVVGAEILVGTVPTIVQSFVANTSIAVSPSVTASAGVTVKCRGYDGSMGAGWYDLSLVGAAGYGLPANGSYSGILYSSTSAGLCQLWGDCTTKVLTVFNNLIAGSCTFKAVASYKSVSYSDTIGMVDQVDPISVVVLCDSGDTFKNGVGSGNVTAKVYQTGVEIDPLGTTTDFNYKWAKTDKNGNLVAGALFTPKSGNIGTAIAGVTATQASAGTSVTLSAANAAIKANGYYVFGSETIARRIATVSGTAVTLDTATSSALGSAITIKPITDNMKTIYVTSSDISEKASYICDLV